MPATAVDEWFSKLDAATQPKAMSSSESAGIDSWFAELDSAAASKSESPDFIDINAGPSIVTDEKPYTFESHAQPGQFPKPQTKFEAATERLPKEARDRVQAAQGAMDETTLDQKAINAIQAGGKAVASGVASIPQAIAIAAKTIDNFGQEEAQVYKGKDAKDLATYRLGTAIEKLADDLLPMQDPRQADSFVTQTLPEAAGSMATFVAGGVAGGGTKAIALLGAGLGAVDQYEDAKANGADETTALQSAGLGGAVGLSEALPFGRFIDRFTKGGGRKIVEALKSLVEEGVQEGAQSIAQDLIAKGLYDPKREVGSTAFREASAGGILGFLMNLGAAALGGRLRRGPRDSSRKAFDDAGLTGPEFASKSQRQAYLDNLKNQSGGESVSPDQSSPPPPDTVPPEVPPESAGVSQSMELPNEKAQEGQVKEELLTTPPAQAEPATATPAPIPEPKIDYASLPLKELRERAKEVGIAKPAQIGRSALIARLQEEENYIRIPMPDGDVMRLPKEKAGMVTIAAPGQEARPVEQSDFAPKTKKTMREKALREMQEVEAEFNRQGVSLGSTDPRQLPLYLKYGKAWLALNVADFVEFSKHMAQRFGEAVREHLQSIWDDAKANPFVAEEADKRPDLTNPGETPEAQAQFDRVDAARTVTEQPKARSRDVARKAAQERIAKNYEAEKARLRETGATNGLPGLEADVIASWSVANRELEAAIKSGSVKQLAEASFLTSAARSQKADIARALGTQGTRPGQRGSKSAQQVVADTTKAAIVELVTEPSPAVKKEIQEATASGDIGRIEAAHQKAAEETRKVIAGLKERKIDLKDLDAIAANPRRAANALRTIQTRKAGHADAIYEYWNNAIMSSLDTASANTISNVGNAAMQLTTKRLAEATINLIVRDPKSAQFGEFKHLLQGAIPGILLGWRNMVLTFDTEMDQLERQIGVEPSSNIEEKKVSIAGAKGRIIRIPWRVNRAVDNGVKSMVWRMQVAALAYRSGKAQGLEGDALTQHIAKEVANPWSGSASDALAFAQEVAFQQKGSKIGQTVKGVAYKARELPGARYVLPFIRTAVNILEVGMKMYAPIAAADAAVQIRKAAQSGDWSKVTPAAANLAIASGVMLALMWQDDDDPWITGKDHATNKYSVRIGDTWYSYRFIEPFATFLGLQVDTANAIKTGSAAEIIRTPISSMAAQIENKTYLRTVGDIMEMVREAKNEGFNSAARWASKFAASWVPNIYRRTIAELQGAVPERRVFGGNTFDRTLQSTEIPQRFGRLPDNPKVDLWGDEIPTGLRPNSLTDAAWKIMLPMPRTKDATFVGDRALANWNVQHPDETIKRWEPPNPRYELAGEKKVMTPQQYEDFCKLAGQMSKAMVGRMKFDPEKPTAQNIKTIERMIGRARDAARKMMIGEALAKK